MTTVGVKQLKNRLTQYLRRAKHGEEVVVTERGKPIALIQRIESADRVTSLEARLAKLAVLGRVALPTRRPLRQVRRSKVIGRPVSEIILEDRR